jgi:hypothetical protein
LGLLPQIHSRTLLQEKATLLDVSFPHVYASLVDVRHRTSRISAVPAMAFAVGALVVDLAVLVLPLNLGSSLLSYALGEGSRSARRWRTSSHCLPKRSQS